MSYNYCNTVKVFCQKNIGNELGEFLNQNNYKQVLILTGGTTTSTLAKKVLEKIKDLECLIINGIVSNPLSEKIEEIVKLAKQFHPEIILTVGGGSVHDTGKAVSVMLSIDSGEISDYMVDGRYSVPGIVKAIPIITIPTLCGSGAEVSPAALIRIGNKKRVMFSPLLHPIATFIYTDFTKNASLSILRRSTFDSFIQALEGYLSLKSNNISDSFAKIAIENYCYCVESLIKDTLDDDKLEKLFIASIFSSYVCSTASVGAIHALSDPISGRFDIHHGTALAMVTKDVLRKNLTKVDSDRIISLNRLLIFNQNPNLSVEEKICKLIENLELLDGINKEKVESDVLNSMILESYNSDMDGNPYNFSNDEIELILRNYYND